MQCTSPCKEFLRHALRFYPLACGLVRFTDFFIFLRPAAVYTAS